MAAHRDQTVSSAWVRPLVSSVVSKLSAKVQIVNILGFGTVLVNFVSIARPWYQLFSQTPVWMLL